MRMPKMLAGFFHPDEAVPADTTAAPRAPIPAVVPALEAASVPDVHLHLVPMAPHARFSVLDEEIRQRQHRMAQLHARIEHFRDVRALHEETANGPAVLQQALAAEETAVARVEITGVPADRTRLHELRAELDAAEKPAADARRELSLDDAKISEAHGAIQALNDELRDLLNRRAAAAEDCLQAELDGLAEEFHAARANYVDIHQRIFAYALACDTVTAEKPNVQKRWARRNAELLLPLPEGFTDRTSRQAIAEAVESGAIELLRKFKLHA